MATALIVAPFLSIRDTFRIAFTDVFDIVISLVSRTGASSGSAELKVQSSSFAEPFVGCDKFEEGKAGIGDLEAKGLV